MRVHLRLKSKKEKGETTVLLTYYSKEDNRYFKRSTGIKLTPKIWDFKKEEIKGGSILNVALFAQRDRLEKVLTSLIYRGELLSIRNIISLYDEEDGKNMSFGWVVEQYISSKTIATSTIASYHHLKRRILHYKEDFNINKDYTEEFLDSYMKYLEVEGLGNTSMHQHLALLKVVVKFSNKKKYSSVKLISKHVKKDAKTKVALSRKEILKIQNLDNAALTINQVLIKDVFLLLCATSLRFSDVGSIRNENVRDNFIHLNQQKTSGNVSVPLNELSSKILRKYNYSLPKLPTLKIFNRHIKRICRKSGITQEVEVVHFYQGKKNIYSVPKYNLVTSHTGRRSYITHLIKKGVPHQIIMKISGHSSYVAFSKYVRLELNDISESLANVF